MQLEGELQRARCIVVDGDAASFFPSKPQGATSLLTPAPCKRSMLVAPFVWWLVMNCRKVPQDVSWSNKCACHSQRCSTEGQRRIQQIQSNASVDLSSKTLLLLVRRISSAGAFIISKTICSLSPLCYLNFFCPCWCDTSVYTLCKLSAMLVYIEQEFLVLENGIMS